MSRISVKKWLAVGIILLFFGVAIAPGINADVNEPATIEPEVVEAKFENLVGLINGIISYYERTYSEFPDYDCGCKDSSPSWERIWPFPIICLSLTPGLILGLAIFMMSGVEIVFNMVWALGIIFNCFWTRASLSKSVEA